MFEIDPESCRIHDFYDYKPFNQYNRDSRDLDRSLADAHVLEDNLTLVDVYIGNTRLQEIDKCFSVHCTFWLMFVSAVT